MGVENQLVILKKRLFFDSDEFANDKTTISQYMMPQVIFPFPGTKFPE